MPTAQLRTASSACAILAALSFAAPAFAQSESDSFEDAPIVVTAQRRAEAQVDVPISVANLSAEQLDTARVDQLSDISKITPALRFDNAGAFFQPTIRGIGTAVVTSGGGGNVGIYVDGFYSPNPLATDFSLMNVQSIQVLKGPQGTLFGRNTTGGAILVQSAEPSTERSGRFKVSYGRYNEAKAQAYYTFGISDHVAMDFEGLYRRGDGWLRDITSGRKVGDYENWSGRIGLKAELSDRVSVLLRYQHSNNDDPTPALAASYTGPDIASGAPNFALPNQVTFNRDRIGSGSVPEFIRANSDVVQGTLKVDLDFADFTSYSQYRNEIVDASLDLDYSGADIFQLGLPNFNETWSQEFLLTSKPGSKFQWTAGLFYFQNKDTYVTWIDNFGSSSAKRIRVAGSSTTTKSYAGFLDATYEVTPQLFVTAGARYAYDKIDGAYYNFPNGTGNKVFISDISPAAVDRVNSGRITPRFAIRYKPTEQTSVYASYTKGYKAAILDVGGGSTSCPNPPSAVAPCSVEPEKVTAYEVGVKMDNRQLSFELAGFYYDYKNLQVSLFLDNRAKIVNAASSEIYGLDGTLRYKLSDKFQVNIGAAWVHARYKSFPGAPIYTNCLQLGQAAIASCAANGLSFLIVPRDLRNVTMQRTPEFTGNVGARYAADLAGGQLALSGNLFYSSKFFFGPSGIQFPQKGYEVLSLRAEWTDPSDTYSIALYGDNVTNSRYKTQVQYGNFGIGSNWSKPVTFGVEAGVKF